MNLPRPSISLRLLVALLAGVLLSCQLAQRAAQPETPPGTTPSPPAGETALPTAAAPTPPPAEGVLYTQTFDGPAVTGWDMQAINDEFGQVQRDLFDGAYRWRITASQGVFAWVYPDLPVEAPAAEFYYAVTVRLGDAPAEAAFGPLFGVRDGGNLYYFKASGLGEYALYVRANSSFTPLIEETASTAIQTGPGAVNRLAVERAQGLVRLYANDALLTEIPLPASEGTIGLAAELFLGQIGTFYFDDVILCRSRCQ